MSEHFIEQCQCGFVVGQCQCAVGLGEKKTVRIVPCTHPAPSVTGTPTPSALTREQVEAYTSRFYNCGFLHLKKVFDDHDAALRATIEQQAQEIARLKDKWAERRANLIEHYEGEIARVEEDAQLGRDLCVILQHHVGETGLTEGAVEVLKRTLQRLVEVERERGAAVSVCDDFKRGFQEARQQLAAMTREREAMRDKTDFYKAEIDRADVLLNRFGIPNIAHECGDMLKPVDERIELVFVQMDVLKQQVAQLRESMIGRLQQMRKYLGNGRVTEAQGLVASTEQALRETGA